MFLAADRGLRKSRARQVFINRRAFLFPKCEIEDRPLPRLRLRPDSSHMLLDDAAHGGQADAGALEIGFSMQTLKRGKQLVRVAHIEAHAVIAHKEGGRAISKAFANLNGGMLAGARV